MPGRGFRTLEAKLRLGFLHEIEQPGELYSVRLPPIEASQALDYAIIAVDGVPAQRYPHVNLRRGGVRDRQSLYLVHHPAGRPQKLTRTRCQAARTAIVEGDLAHHCDTLGGSSGALMFSVDQGAFVGLHKAGRAGERPVNFATPALNLFSQSAELRRLFPERAAGVGRVAETQPPPPQPAAQPAAQPGGRAFKDCDVCPEMVVVPAGSFLMGSPEGEPGRASDEGPRQRITFAQPLAVGKFEVTFAEFDACVADGGCSRRPGDQGWGRGRRPVINVNWNEAQAYAAWLRAKTGKPYRLLTEAEWEYATRAGTTTAYAFGDTITSAQARFGNPFGRTVEVGRYPPNAFGLHDMHGNVFEWVEDCYRGNLSGQTAAAYTTGDCSGRVNRGGSWNYYPQFLRSAFRFRSTPTSRDDIIGFRLARTL